MRLEECTLSDMYKIWLDMEIGLGVLQTKLPFCCEYEKINWTASLFPESGIKGYTLVKWTNSISYLTMKTRVISVLMVKIYTLGKLKKYTQILEQLTVSEILCFFKTI